MTKLQAIRYFVEIVTGVRPIIPRRDEWSMEIPDKHPRIIVPQDFDPKPFDKEFRADFVSRCPLARGFANVTISILHECGHYATQDDFDVDDYNAQVEAVGLNMNAYMNISYERMATDWAIGWLMDADHRKQAKDFEKKFYGRG